jgi:hypothetical protein
LTVLEKGTTSLDETLRAIVAADRLQLSETIEGRELLRRRLRVFYGYFAILCVLSAVAVRVTQFPLDARTQEVRLIHGIQIAHAVLLCVVVVGLRFLVRDRQVRVMHALDLLATVATVATAAFALSVMPHVVTMDVSVVTFFVLFFVVRVALVPSNPWAATALASITAVPITFGLLFMYRRAGVAVVPDPEAATFAALRTLAAGVFGVYVVSRTINGLRNAVEKAVQLGQYVVQEKIGEGGMGAVYRASHTMLKRPTAIKVIPPDRGGKTSTERFEREVMATSRLTHPNNVAIYDYGRTRGGVFYYAMELLDGLDLQRIVEREGPQSVPRTRQILRQLAAALSEAHDAGLVHRDVKPQNVMLCTRGGIRDFVKVLDFGLVRETLPQGDATVTQANTILGTPLYIAPETILAPETAGPPADIYAVGCVAHFLLTGRPPFEGATLIEICAAHLHQIPAPPSRAAPEVSPELDALVLRCLQKEPSARPTAHQIEAALTN